MDAVTPPTRMLLVEDDPKIVAMLARGLSEEGFSVEVASDGRAGLEGLCSDRFEVCVLDLGLPHKDGLEVLSEARAAGYLTPVLVLTARDAVPDRVMGLNGGADDYLTKPFAFAELLARLRALLRRGPEPKRGPLTSLDLSLDPARHRVTRAGESIELSKTQFALLECLLRNKGEVVSRARILDRVFQYGFDPGTNIVDVHVAQLRKKIDRATEPSLITTVRGVGYRLRTEADD